MYPVVLPPDHYRVLVTYAEPLFFADLEKQFGTGNVSKVFKHYLFENHASCDVVETEQERIFWVAAPPPNVLGDSEKIIIWGNQQRSVVAPNGYYPATKKEYCDFQQGRLMQLLVPLGSSAIYRGYKSVPGLYSRGDKPVLGSYWFIRQWGPKFRFLFVAKPTTSIE